MKFYFNIEKRNELLEKHTMREYAEFLDITVPFLCQILNRKKHTTKHMAFAISICSGIKDIAVTSSVNEIDIDNALKNIDYYFTCSE